MNDERTDLERRAARHAALGDPARLRVVELLALGDRSPGELRTQLGIASNLLAHHLGVLEAEGLIARTRSEGDRRRSYVRLVPGALAGLVPEPRLSARRIVFVCTGNSARSPLAAALWAVTSSIPATSAGTHPAARTSPAAIAAAERHGLDLTGHTPRPVGRTLTDGTAIITVCDRAREELGASRCTHWSIPNPGAIGTPEAYEAAFDDIARRVRALAPHVAA
ncbi:helix-turn-helix domain-containing protein [Propionicicella superfundia]|uniref:arsenate reductase/protein-tyrosine-phosphatase family protein n=1 Tax=Propionicicella superfundia TaxID=348582 RepID=UPI0004240E44|nr:helix-turn-helix domain-containing protein [Propionicicella superfundia]